MKDLEISKRITEAFIEAIEKSTITGKWVRPWKSAFIMPRNLFTKRQYNGMNALMLMYLYGGGEFATFNQIKKHGLRLKDAKGKGVHVVFPVIDKETKDFKYWGSTCVFSSTLIEGLPQPEQTTVTVNRIPEIEECITRLNIKIVERDSAAFIPSIDTITMPGISTFDSIEHYYGTLLHEVAHWTGHSSREGRLVGENARFGSEAYAFEELVAELASTFLCAHFGIEAPVLDNHFKYLSHWLGILKGDVNAIRDASKLATKAMQCILPKGTVPVDESVDFQEAA